MCVSVDVKDIAWVAGLLEGEGNFMSDPSGSLARIKLEMTDEDVVRKAASIMGAPSVGYRIKSNPKWKPTYVFYLCGAKAAGWMMTLYPFLGKRRRQKIRTVLCHWANGPVARYYIRNRGRG